MNVVIRLSEISDAESIAQIYNREVLESFSTFDLRPRTIEEQLDLMRGHGGAYPITVATIEDKIAGFASLSPYKIRPGYSTTVENSVYVAKQFRNLKIGTTLLEDIILKARLHGFHTIIARVSNQNLASSRLHETCGFNLVGIEKEVGRKFGRWLDVSIYQLMLASG